MLESTENESPLRHVESVHDDGVFREMIPTRGENGQKNRKGFVWEHVHSPDHQQREMSAGEN